MLSFKNKKFYLDGKEFKIRGGTLHYFRVLPEYWEELMQKYKAAGLNCVETYCCWNVHEPEKGKFNFSGGADVVGFIELAQKTGLKVILRPGPFICAEWENGGIPYWLLKDPNLRLRCNKEPFIGHLRDWFKVLLGKIKPLLDTNGGPIIAIALENEYGDFGDDFEYLSVVENIYRQESIDCLFFSADGDSNLSLCTGSNGNIIKGLDFECVDVDLKSRFAKTDVFMNGEAPYFASEFWGGNFTRWGREKFFQYTDENFRKNISQMIENNINFDDYMFYGGTNFGFMAGANMVPTEKGEVYNSIMTSYDYDAAITEWGDYTDRYFIMRELLAAESGEELPQVPPAPQYQNIGKVELKQSAELFSNMQIAKTVKSKTVEPMEYYGQDYGYILYRKVMNYAAPHTEIQLSGLSDRAHVFLNGKLLGIRCRTDDESVIPLKDGLKKGDVVDIFVENMGRVNYRFLTYKGDKKGITDGILFTDRVIFDWEVSSFDMRDISAVNYNETTTAKCPAFFKGEFKAEYNKECFVNMSNFTKGIVFVNGFNLGRYWDIGPQYALYIPGKLLRENNEITVFETDSLKGEPCVEISDKPSLFGKTHGVRL